VRLSIHHRTRYGFDGEVFLEPHVVRLQPRVEPGVRVLDYALSVAPDPVVRAEHLDPYGNVVTELWFGDSTTTLDLESRATVERLETNPFEYILAAHGLLPQPYPQLLARHLAPYIDAPRGVAEPVRALAWDIAREVSLQPDRYAPALAARLHGTLAYVVRDQGLPQPAAVTLETGAGACRDLAVLFVACCRAVGLAARFVSGYAHAGDTTPPPELHAWGEAYVAGGGWRGFDPADGLAVASRHVAVAAGPEAEDAAPVSGTFRSNGYTSTLDATLEISRA
jgi:transglutaminase-like putative cysteine protease